MGSGPAIIHAVRLNIAVEIIPPGTRSKAWQHNLAG